MFASPWAYRRCTTLLARSADRFGRRLASNNAAAVEASISPALLSRARKLAQEHSQLLQQSQHETTYDAQKARRLGELQRTADALQEYETRSSALGELNTLLSDPGTEAELRDLAADEISGTAAALEAVSRTLSTALTPAHPFAHLGCLIEIRPGAGGQEANIFAAEILRMYRTLLSRAGMPTDILKYETTEGMTDASGTAPLQEAIFQVDSPGAYAIMRSEAGVHRVQRIPVTDSKGRVQTSAVSVIVLPSIPDASDGAQTLNEADLNDPTSDYYVNVTEVRTDVMRARGAGGQHVNTTESAVRLTHIPTNTVVTMQDSRSQHKNKASAWAILRSRLAAQRRTVREEEAAALRRSIVGHKGDKTGREDKVRTYNFGQSRVTDHRSGVSLFAIDEIMDGGEALKKLMEGVRDWLAERDLEMSIAEAEAKEQKPK